MGYEIDQAVRAACLWLPQAEKYLSHGSPSFRVRGKTFASYVVNHHGDGCIALWLNTLPGAQELYVAADSKRYFVPPYRGPQGWLGVRLDRGLAWSRISALVREAYEKVAPPALSLAMGRTPAIKTPTVPSPGDIDPMRSARGVVLLTMLRRICLGLPESREVIQFGCPAWQAGRKTFAWARCSGQRLAVCVWVGVETQAMLAADDRYRIPAYLGGRGWIDLDVHDHCDEDEVRNLALTSYRHFALKRMLQTLDVGVE